ncbi:hypothetical protein HA466_0304200 [Hirschfeldia incana]|nr:hypothetical protein HA466_0304200 [Hirschfeldia incana]
MEYLPHLRLLRWDVYPGKNLPPTFQPQFLVKLCMKFSKLEKLWEGIQPLANLKTLDLANSYWLKEIPNLSEATNLETLLIYSCSSLVELPSSIRNLHKLEELDMRGCKKLRIIPTNINLASLEAVQMADCPRLRTFPDISSNISYLDIQNTKIEDIPSSNADSWIRLEELYIGSSRLKRLTHVPLSLEKLDLSDSDIRTIPDCVIGLPGLRFLIITNCRKLVSLQGLQSSLRYLHADDCVLLKSVCLSFCKQNSSYINLDGCKCVKSEKNAIRVSSTFYYPRRNISLFNCFSLDEEARRVIIQQWDYQSVVLPGKEVPPEFTHRAKGNSITIISSGTFSASSRFKACLLPSTSVEVPVPSNRIVCRVRSKGVIINELDFYSTIFGRWSKGLPSGHMFVFSGALFKEHTCLALEATTSEIQFEFSCISDINGIIGEKIIECGVQMLEEECEMNIYSSFDDPNREVKFLNCMKLDEEAKRAIVQQWAYKYVCFPGKEIPAEFTRKATGNSINISEGTLSASTSFKACILLSPNLSPNLQHPPNYLYYIVCRLRSKGILINELEFYPNSSLLTEHLLVFRGALFKERRCVEVVSDIQFEFSCHEKYFKIIECGVQIMAEEGESSSSEWIEQSNGAAKVSKDENVIKTNKNTGWWCGLRKLVGLKKKKNKRE